MYTATCTILGWYGLGVCTKGWAACAGTGRQARVFACTAIDSIWFVLIITLWQELTGLYTV